MIQMRKARGQSGISQTFEGILDAGVERSKESRLKDLVLAFEVGDPFFKVLIHLAGIWLSVV
jgi:dihydroxyacetone kinase-like predicted kinase